MTLRSHAARAILPALAAGGLMLAPSLVPGFAPAFAQTPPAAASAAPPAAAAPAAPAHARSSRSAEAGRDRSAAAMQRVETRLSAAKDALQITDAQTPQWDAFASSVRSGARALQGLHEEMVHGARGKDWPARVEWQAKLLEARLDALQTVANAGKPLYAVLTDDQKKQADKLMTRISATE